MTLEDTGEDNADALSKLALNKALSGFNMVVASVIFRVALLNHNHCALVAKRHLIILLGLASIRFIGARQSYGIVI
jgi:hypothetical protein